MGRLRARPLRGPSRLPPCRSTPSTSIGTRTRALRCARPASRNSRNRSTRRGSTRPARYLHDSERAGGTVQDLGRLSRLRGGTQLRRGGRGVRVRCAFTRRRDAAGLSIVPPCSSACQGSGRMLAIGLDRPGCGGVAGRPWTFPTASTATGPCGSRSPARTRRRTRSICSREDDLQPVIEGARSAQPPEPADPGQHRLPLPGDGRHQGRCVRRALGFPRRSLLRRRRALHLVGDGCRGRSGWIAPTGGPTSASRSASPQAMETVKNATTGPTWCWNSRLTRPLQPIVAQCVEDVVSSARLRSDTDAGQRYVPRLSRSLGHALQDRRAPGFRRSVSAARAHRPPVARTSEGRAEDLRRQAGR